MDTNDSPRKDPKVRNMVEEKINCLKECLNLCEQTILEMWVLKASWVRAQKEMRTVTRN